MKPSTEQFALRVMSGEARGPVPALLRGLLSIVEPGYAAVVSFRNRRFDGGVGVRRLPRPVVSVGNVTAGGTGKTPVVRWLCESLRGAGHHPAVLLRGYRAKPGGRGDEEVMLDGYLNDSDAETELCTTDGLPAAGGSHERPSTRPRVMVHANPSRFDGGTAVLARAPWVDVFVLDDGFQHRRLARDFDLVLIDAASPFGYGHVHPRGLLREPLRGLKRADAILLTRSDATTEAELAAIESRLRRWNSFAPIYRARHAHTGFRVTDAPGRTRLLPLAELAGRRAFAFCGIGRPESFLRQLGELPGAVVGHQWFPDHHAYTADDAASIANAAVTVKSDVLLTTEKDWVKFAALTGSSRIPVWRVELSIAFREGDEPKLLDQIRGRIDRSPV